MKTQNTYKELLKILLLCFGIFIGGIISGLGIGYKLGYNKGWMSCCLDSIVIKQYHTEADKLENDDDPIALAKCWYDATNHIQKAETVWNNMSVFDKYRLDYTPFWKKNIGQPRRISKSQKKKFVETIEQFYKTNQTTLILPE